MRAKLVSIRSSVHCAHSLAREPVITKHSDAKDLSISSAGGHKQKENKNTYRCACERVRAIDEWLAARKQKLYSRVADRQ